MRTRVYVPRETAAASLGADAVAVEIARESKARGENIRLVRNGSWGASWLEPMVEVEFGDQRIAYSNVRPEDVASLFDADFLAGGEHALHRGPTAEIPWLINQQRWTFFRCGLMEALSLDDFTARGGFKGFEKALELGPEKAVDVVVESGLRGRGGAGFPTGIKWRTVAEAEGEQKYIACNADEGDSGTFSDRLLMESDPYCLLEGMLVAGWCVGASKGYIYLRSEYPLALSILSKALDTARDAGWLGDNIRNSGFNFDIDIHLGAGSYVCGEETAMLESLEGKRGMVRAKPPLPAIEGLFGKPTVVNNVVTLGSVANILRLGAERYREFGTEDSAGTLAFQLAGNIRRGGLVELGLGVSLRDLIEDWGGGTASGRPVAAVQVGGPLGAYLGADELDVPMSYEGLQAIEGLLGHGGIVVFDDTVNMQEQARFALAFCAIESCGKCTPCRIGSQRGVEIIDRLAAGGDAPAELALLDELCDTMEDASLCAMGGLTPYPVRSAVRKFPQHFGKQGDS